MSDYTAADFAQSLARVAAAMAEHRDELCRLDGAVGDDSGGGEGDGDDDESSVAAPHGKLAEPAASKTSRPSCRARRVIFLII